MWVFLKLKDSGSLGETSSEVVGSTVIGVFFRVFMFCPLLLLLF